MMIMTCGTGLVAVAPRNRRRVMITYADVEKLLAARSEEPPVLSASSLRPSVRKP
jgi:hypothetical protein